MVLSQHKYAVGVFSSRQDAEQALHELHHSGFPMNKVSIIARDADRQGNIAGVDVSDSPGTTKHGNKADEGATAGAVTGGALGGLTGLLVGLGTLAIPGIGPIMLAGEVATALATTVVGGAVGAIAGGLVGGLIGLGIPEERARVYNHRVHRGDYLVIVNGTDDQIRHAEAILNHRGIEEFGVYEQPNVEQGRSDYAIATPISAVTSSDVIRNKNAVGFFPDLGNAGQVINTLRQAGFPLSQVSLVGQNFERKEPLVGVDVRDRLEAMRLGLPQDHARFYNDRVMRGDYAVILNGTEDELQGALSILSDRRMQGWQIYDPTVVGSTVGSMRTDYATTTQTPNTVHRYEQSSAASTRTNEKVVGHRPEIVIVDHRDETL